MIRALERRLKRLEGPGTIVPPVVVLFGRSEEELASQESQRRAEGRLAETARVVRVLFVRPGEER